MAEVKPPPHESAKPSAGGDLGDRRLGALAQRQDSGASAVILYI